VNSEKCLYFVFNSKIYREVNFKGEELDFCDCDCKVDAIFGFRKEGIHLSKQILKSGTTIGALVRAAEFG